MRVKIEIECENAYELLQHLYKIRKDIRGHLKRNGNKTVQQQEKFIPTKRMKFEDHNCYGDHTVKIQP